MKLGIYSKGIWQIPNLREFLGEYELVFRRKANKVAGWGLKRSTILLRKWASWRNIPYIALEDGFLRSYDLGVNGAAPFSMVVDALGIYYDASSPSQLENLIRAEPDAEKVKRAEKLIEFIKEHQLSKYNCNIDGWKGEDVPSVLVIDQSKGDAAIKYGMADEASFTRMLEAAKRENPNHRILVKTHPDVASGKREGYLKDLTGVTLVTENINPHQLFNAVEKVYTVSSLMGFEALLHNKPVHCFGAPFYAGWGVTVDEISIARRDVKRSVAEIFAAAYFDYTRYVNPYNGQRCEAEEVAEILADLKSYYAKHQRNYHCLGFSKWKRYFIAPYLKSPANKVVFYKSEKKAVEAARKDGGVVVVWAAREKHSLKALAGEVPIYRVEDGFIRSAGLGSDFIVANSLSIDKTGIHFDHSAPSDLENILNGGLVSENDILRAKALRQFILNNSVTKYNTEKNEARIDLPKGRKSILAVGQVEDDASIRLGSPEIKTNQQLINAIRKDNPDAFIIYKPHPDVLSGNRKGAKIEVENADLVITNVGIHSVIKIVDEVHTITSLVGFESLLHEKKVVVYGLPFYVGWGLTKDKLTHPRRVKKIALDELVAAVLIKYPSYYDFDANLPTTPERIVQALSQKQPPQPKIHLLMRIRNGLTSVFKS